MFKKINGQYVVGFDLEDTYSQISYWKCGTQAPVTASAVNGQEAYNIPTVLCKRKEVNQWFWGRDAFKVQETGEGILIKNLLSLARKGTPVSIGEEEVNPVRLLVLFMKRALSLIQMEVPLDRIVTFMITTRQMDYRTVEILNEVSRALELGSAKVLFQSHMESFYYYMIYQPEELWLQDVLLYDFSGAHLISYRLERNRRTTPIVAFIDAKEYESFRKPKFAEDTSLKQELKDAMDEQFLQAVQDTVTEHVVSSVFLIGDGFAGEWEKESLRLLCRNRRVFQGNNLFCKGACYGAYARVDDGENNKNYVFLGDEKLKANVGMKVYRQNKESYLALLDAGVNWFEAARECEVYLGAFNKLSFLITPVTGKNVREIEMVLNGLPIREKHMTRIYVSMQMITEKKVKVCVEDLGFGQICPSSGLEWTQEFEL